MAILGIEASDTRDHLDRGRFFTYGPSFHLNSLHNRKFWYWNFLSYPEKQVRIMVLFECVVYLGLCGFVEHQCGLPHIITQPVN